MTKNSIILKSVAHMVIVVMLYMHVCSALCATSSHGCCGKEENENDLDKKECCSREKKTTGETSDCQDMHLSFFNTTGQYSQIKADISIKSFQSLVGVIIPVINIAPVSVNKNIFAYNGFHSPPPKADIRIFISSFQI